MTVEEKNEKKGKMSPFAKVCVYIVTAITPVAGTAVVNFIRDLDQRVEDVEKTQTAAFHTIYENETINQRQWEILGAVRTNSEANRRVLDLYNLLLVSDQIDIEKLSEAMAVVRAIEQSGLSEAEIKTALHTLQRLKSLNPFGHNAPKPAVLPTLPAPVPVPNVQQQQSTRPDLLSPEELQRYIEQKKGGVKK